ncbi:hypothetical protein NFI96_016742 [Prochilodus magdalenae]|nr:hypothetical protein NFI96_016742 [Prochilodus magdalenae]
MTVLVSIREDVKAARKEILKIQKDIEEIKEHIGTHHDNKESPGPALILPLKTVDDFMDAEPQLQTKAVRCKTVSRFAVVGGGTPEAMIRRVLQSAMTNELAWSFNWAGKGAKRPFKDSTLKDCIFAPLTI